VTEFFTELGIPAPGFNAVLASTAEFVCGTLLLLGLLSRVASLPLDRDLMTVRAILTAKRDALHGIRRPLLGFEEWTYIVLAGVDRRGPARGLLAGPPPAACNVFAFREHSSARPASSGHGSSQ